MNLIFFLNEIIKSWCATRLINPKTFILVTYTPLITVTFNSTAIKAALLLLILFILDFLTGIGASYIGSKKSDNNTSKYFIKSSQLRLSVVKFITYGMGILVAYGLEWVFILDHFNIHKGIQTISLKTLVIAFFCFIEFYSIFFENVKRMGFDIILKVKNISRKSWDIYNTIKNNERTKST